MSGKKELIKHKNNRACASEAGAGGRHRACASEAGAGGGTAHVRRKRGQGAAPWIFMLDTDKV